MNGVRSISMRKGYLLTALAAAVLLAASSGTAYAQSIGFSGSRATIMEGASSRMHEDPRAHYGHHQHQRAHRWKATTPIGKMALEWITLVHNADVWSYGMGKPMREGNDLTAAARLVGWREFSSR